MNGYNKKAAKSFYSSWQLFYFYNYSADSSVSGAS